ncbi:Fc.00g072330.m01.CDS01 [Cosmosporella sp. VM-42]
MATKETATTNSFKYQWARHVARLSLKDDLAVVRGRITDPSTEAPPELGVIGDESVAKLLRKTQELTGLGFVPPKEGQFKVGIVGAGVAGLFTALVFDWLNERPELQKEQLKIDYDIIEAAGEERLGGRLYTHQFSAKEHDYYDVGAMRFPNNAVMKRTFQLFDYIGIKEGKEGLIPYYLADENNVCPSYFNDIPRVGDIWKQEGVNDPYGINSGLPDKGKIPAELLQKDPSELVSTALKDFIDKTKEKFEAARAEKDGGSKSTARTSELWNHLMKADNMSVRQFLSSKDNGPDIPKGPGYNFNTIEWLETATYGTGWYDQALSESVLEEIDFATPEQEEGKPKQNYWWCVDGGAQKIARLMEKKVQKPVQLNNQVLAINANVKDRDNPSKYVPISLEITGTNRETKETKKRKEDYFAVFNSTTLPALQRMNLKDAGLLWGTKQAIRALGYGSSCKVAIKFKTPWWQVEPFNINKGGISRTDLPLRVCVYPSYNIPDAEEHWNPKESSVLLCSYTWGMDAQRLGSLISPDTPDNEDQLKSVLLHDLALLHANKEMPYEKLLPHLVEQYDTHHAWDWYSDENMSGAFAYYGPGQFSNMWEEVLKPNAFGQLYLIGEAASSHHAWIVGALESVIRAIYVMFEGLNSHNPDYEGYKIVMDLLNEGPKDKAPEEKQSLPTGLPFFPLPEEMPERQLNVKRGATLTNDPTNTDPEKPLTYPAAIASLCLIESYFELIYSAQAAQAA